MRRLPKWKTAPGRMYGKFSLLQQLFGIIENIYFFSPIILYESSEAPHPHPAGFCVNTNPCFSDIITIKRYVLDGGHNMIPKKANVKPLAIKN